MKCSEAADWVAYLKGELPETQCASARAHGGRCAACARDLARADAVLRTLGTVETVEPAPDFTDRVRRAFLAAHPQFPLRRGAARARPSAWEAFKARLGAVPSWALSLAVHVVLLSGVAILLFAPAGPEEETTLAVVRSNPRKAREVPRWQGFEGQEIRGVRRIGVPRDPDPTPAHVERGNEIIRPRPRPTLNEVPINTKDWEGVLQPVRKNLFLAFVVNRTTEKAARVKECGGEKAAAAARRGLAWLASQQSSDGRWDPRALGGDPSYEVGLTGLAALAFLAEGHAPSRGEFASTVERAVNYLRSRQKMSGLVGEDTGHYLYNHALGALALLECHLMTRDQALALPVSMAVGYALKAQNSEGGWDYDFGGPHSDTSVTGWMVLLLRMAFEDGNRDVLSSLVLANKRLVAVTDSEGKVGYRTRLDFPNGPYATTAVGMLSYLLSTPVPESSLLGKQAAVLIEGLRFLPVAPDPPDPLRRDLYFWYFGSLALRQYGQVEWEQWQGAVRDPLLKTQQADGSWNRAFDRWSRYGGQVYTTAMGVLILGTPWRYPRLLQ
ncbi:MAG: hypothetical protein HY716_07020 [Planctomycetes bacterium]|nr:hypothetical protein [Planctomycetota bacterium]